jgi:sporulation protein YabP
MKNAEITLWERKRLLLENIEDVISFDDLSIYLITKFGNLLIEGSELHITTLDVQSGKMMVEGLICSILYNDKDSKKKDGFFSKILKSQTFFMILVFSSCDF